MTKLDNICLNIVDCEHKTAPTQETGIPSIRTTDIKKGVIDFNGANKVSVETYKKWTQRLEPQVFDLILAREAPVGEVGIIPDNQKVCLGQRTVLIRPNPEIVDPYYLLLLLLSREIQHEMNIRASGSTVEHLNMSDIRGLQLPKLPPLEEQKAIASVLSCLDEKIENLRKQNETLEAIAQTLFKHWFIDFEFPNEDGKPYKSSGGKMRSTQLGEIPKDWQVGKLGEIGENIRNGIKETEINSEMSYIGLEHIPRKQIALDSWVQAVDIASNKFRFNKGHILFGKLRPYFHKVGVSFTSGVCSTDILVLNAKKESYFGYFLMTVYSDDFIRYVTLASEGTRMPRTNWDYMKNYTIVIPSNLIIEKFDKILKSFITKMEVSINQIQTLTKTRDALLPKLMSGQIRVKHETT